MKKISSPIALLLCIATFAQTKEQREIIKKDINFEKLNQVKEKQERNYFEREARISYYLQKNPNAKR